MPLSNADLFDELAPVLRDGPALEPDAWFDAHTHMGENDPDGTTGYGGIERCDTPCISPLHTHDATGILHTEAKTPKPNTLGQFFTEWGVRLTSTCVADFCDPDTSVAVYVDGKPYSGDPAAIELTFEEEIAVVVGAPPAVIPDSADFSNA